MFRPEALPQILVRRAGETPDRIYARSVGGEDWSYARLEQETLSWANTLAALGVSRGDRVLTMLPNSLDAIAVWMATARLGAIEVPLNTNYRGRFLEHTANNSGAHCAVVAARFVDRFTGSRPQLVACSALVVPDADGSAFDDPAVVSRDDVQATVADVLEPQLHDIATILYTSGTTGASKGALVPWEQVYMTATACPPLDGRDESDVFYSPFPLFHMSGKLAVCAAAILGGQLVVRESFSTSEFWSDIDTYGCTTSLLIGATPVFIAKLPPRDDDVSHPLRNVLLGPPPDEAVAFCERFGIRASVTFNMTELSCPISTGWDASLLARGSVGRLRAGYDVRLVDDDDRPVPVGEIGEILVRSHEPWRLMAGYWSMPEKTVEAWRNLWFHTGDLGRMDPDGAYFFLDRKKDAIRRRGENISSMELEAEIAEYEHVAEAAVVGVPSEVGEEDVKAFVVPAGPSFTPDGLIEFLERRVPAFMIPRYVVELDELPKTPTEKVRKTELKQRSLDEHSWERPGSLRTADPA